MKSKAEYPVSSISELVRTVRFIGCLKGRKLNRKGCSTSHLEDIDKVLSSQRSAMVPKSSYSANSALQYLPGFCYSFWDCISSYLEEEWHLAFQLSAKGLCVVKTLALRDAIGFWHVPAP